MPNPSNIQSDRFEALYDRVTQSLEDYVTLEEKAGNLPPAHALWFRDLIQGFQNEFRLWPSYANNDQARYLQLFEAPGVDPQLRLAAHAFLHIAYDLPRVISRTIGNPGFPLRSQYRTIFVRPGGLFLKAFVSHARAGEFGFLGRLLGRFEPVRMLAYWVIALRSVAWIHAEILADAGGNSVVLERRMAQALLAAGHEAIRHSWIWGVSELDNRDLLAVAPLSLEQIAPKVETALLALFGALIGAFLVLLFLNRRGRRQRVTAQIDALGALVYRYTVRAMNKDLPLPPTSDSSDSQPVIA
jgi:hypothetical protein